MISNEVLERARIKTKPPTKWRNRWRLGIVCAQCGVCDPPHWIEGPTVYVACPVYPSRDVAETAAWLFLTEEAPKFGFHASREIEFLEAFPEGND